MRITFLILSSLLLLSSSYDIIRDLPYNIYHIEDMAQYKNSYLPEGNKFYIRLPFNTDEEIKFSLSIPKNITLFPIYLSEFPKYPSNEEIMNANFDEEIELTNREALEHNIYFFDIKKKGAYQVLYFQNNEILNYLSLYAYSKNASLTISIYEAKRNSKLVINPLNIESSYYIKLNTTDLGKKEIKIKTKADRAYYPVYQLDIKCFSYEPTDDEITTVDNTWKQDLPHDTYYTDSYYDNYNYQTYIYEPKDEFLFCGIHIYNLNYLPQLYIDFYVTDVIDIPVWATILIAIMGIIFLCIICRAVASCRRGNGSDANTLAACLAAMCICSLLAARMASND